jgi:hypothetical protein
MLLRCNNLDGSEYWVLLLPITRLVASSAKPRAPLLALVDPVGRSVARSRSMLPGVGVAGWHQPVVRPWRGSWEVVKVLLSWTSTAWHAAMIVDRSSVSLHASR